MKWRRERKERGEKGERRERRKGEKGEGRERRRESFGANSNLKSVSIGAMSFCLQSIRLQKFYQLCLVNGGCVVSEWDKKFPNKMPPNEMSIDKFICK